MTECSNAIHWYRPIKFVLRKNWLETLKKPRNRIMPTHTGHPVYTRESAWYKRSSVDDRESYTEGFRRMNGISPFPAHSPPLRCLRRSPTMASSSPRHHGPFTNIYSFFFYIRMYVCVQAVRSRWKNTDHFLAFFRRTATLYWHFPPSPNSRPFSLISRVSRRGVDRPGM